MIDRAEFNGTAQIAISDFEPAIQHCDVTDIVTRAPHTALEKEAQRIVEKLPKMTPGMQQDKAVSVKYILPIRFVVE